MNIFNKISYFILQILTLFLIISSLFKPMNQDLAFIVIILWLMRLDDNGNKKT